MKLDKLDLSYSANETLLSTASGLCHWNSCCQHIFPGEQYEALAVEKICLEKN